MIKNITSFLNSSKRHTVSQKMIVASVVLAGATGAFSHAVDANDFQGIVLQPTEEPREILSDRPLTPHFFSEEGSVKMIDENDPAMQEEFAHKLNLFAQAQRLIHGDDNFSGYALRHPKSVSNLYNTICLISYEQPEGNEIDGFYIDRSESILSVIPKHYADFFVKSHEATHCSFTLPIPEEEGLQQDVRISVNEVAADLGAIIDYMRVTGNDNIYDEFIRPFRMGSIGQSTHRTAWALDVILKDVKPSAMHKKEASEIPEIVDFLIRKHMINEAGTDIDYTKKASMQMVAEIFADMDVSSKGAEYSNERNIERYKKDVLNTVYSQINRYEPLMDNEAMFNRHIVILVSAIDRYDLPNDAKVNKKKIKGQNNSIADKSYAEYYMGR